MFDENKVLFDIENEAIKLTHQFRAKAVKPLVAIFYQGKQIGINNKVVWRGEGAAKLALLNMFSYRLRREGYDRLDANSQLMFRDKLYKLFEFRKV